MGTTTGGSPGDRSRAFRERARLEADRYGPDPWIFVRELLQNSRDAGATQVRFYVFGHEGEGVGATVVCQDDGEGMTFEHARRYLFALYASSKEGKKNQAGRFGVGFWSILRFEPVSIVIRSRPRRGEAWGLCLDGSLEQLTPVEAPALPGTEIILRRAHGDSGLERRIYDAVYQSARYLSRRDHPHGPLAIEVNGRRANADFALAAPSAAFRRRKVKGVVGLGPAPRVELFSRGLRVRSAGALEELLHPAGRHSSWMRVHFPELPGGLAPQALLESAELELMLSRSDARVTRSLARLVRLAQRELEGLVKRQLAVARPLPWWTRLSTWLGDRARALPLATAAAVLGLGILLAAGIFAVARDAGSPAPALPPARTAPAGPTIMARPAAVTPPRSSPSAPAAARPFEDLGGRYSGPKVDVLDPAAAEPIALRYWPVRGVHNFAALVFPRLGADGSPIHDPVATPSARYRPAVCPVGRCLLVELPLATDGAAVRIPVPTGHRVVGGSLDMGRHPLRLRASSDGQPVVVFQGPARGVLHYRTVAAPDPEAAGAGAAPASLPAGLRQRAQLLRGSLVRRRVAVLLDLVRARVAYETSAGTAGRHRRAIARGEGFIRRTLAIGAGDCDVQNGLLTALLRAAGVPARLAVGYQGEGGAVLPWLHAWVEYQDEHRRWHVADATTVTASPPVAAGRAAAPSAVVASGPVAARDRSPPAAPVLLPALVAPLATVGSVPSPSPSPSPDGWGLRLSPLLLLLALLPFLPPRTRRAFKLDAQVDLARLLQGALRQPVAFGPLSALFHRPLVPLADGRMVSLMKARTLASRGRLFRTWHRPELARHAQRAGAAVLDDRLDEGKAVGDALGAVDLDGWAAMLQSATAEPLLNAANDVLREHGAEWAVRASARARTAVTAIDLRPLRLRLPGVHGTRLVMIDTHAPWLAEARQLFVVRPRRAIFMLLDQVASRLQLPEPQRERLLGECARAAIMETVATR